MIRVATDFAYLTVGLGYSFLNGIKEHPRALGNPDDLKAVCNNVDYMFCGDGRYKFYDTEEDYSTDGSYEYIKDTYKNAIMYKYAGRQTDKRQKYLDLAGQYKCDFLIVMDSDEYIDPRYNDWELFYHQLYIKKRFCPNENIFNIKCFMNPKWKKAYNVVKNNTWKRYVKVHKNPGEFRYAFNRHYWWTRKKYSDEFIAEYHAKCEKRKVKPRMKLQEYAMSTIDGIRINTDSTLRTPEQLKLRQKWAKMNWEWEDSELIRITAAASSGIKDIAPNPLERFR